ncbi:MAG: hypothetical protein COA78_27410 [Blastopirellula sp.]|nr:MAG: hypothetical protein COA78_27410 [Blastopirellula sp.]
MNEATEDILNRVKLMVASGFCDLEEIHDTIEEMSEEESDADEVFLLECVGKEIKKIRADEKSWPAVTDCDRLESAFDNLNENQIIAMHVAGYTTSDGVDDACELREEMGEENVIGFCFYHEQDLERVVNGDELYIAYGSYSDNDEKNIVIAELVKAELEEQGLKVTWNGDPKERILISKFDWKRRGPLLG